MNISKIKLPNGTTYDIVASKLVFNDLTVSTNAWVSDTTYSDYGYKAAIALSGVTSDMLPEVVFTPSSLNNIFANVCATYDGGVYIYASQKPSGDVKILSVIAWR